jgi:hypothetical protein
MRTTHIKYRTKDQMAEGVYHILRYSDFSPAAKLAVIDDVCWKWSEFEGKVKNNLICLRLIKKYLMNM